MERMGLMKRMGMKGRAKRRKRLRETDTKADKLGPYVVAVLQ